MHCAVHAHRLRVPCPPGHGFVVDPQCVQMALQACRVWLLAVTCDCMPQVEQRHSEGTTSASKRIRAGSPCSEPPSFQPRWSQFWNCQWQQHPGGFSAAATTVKTVVLFIRDGGNHPHWPFSQRQCLLGSSRRRVGQHNDENRVRFVPSTYKPVPPPRTGEGITTHWNDGSGRLLGDAARGFAPAEQTLSPRTRFGLL